MSKAEHSYVKLAGKFKENFKRDFEAALDEYLAEKELQRHKRINTAKYPFKKLREYYDTHYEKGRLLAHHGDEK